MKVVIVNDHLYPDGGADMVALASAEGLARLGLDVTYFAADRQRPGDATARSYKVVCTGQMDLANDPNRGRVAVQGIWNAPAARNLRELLEQFDPATTIVHVHSWTKALSSSVFRAASEAGFKVVCTLHDYFSVCPNGMLFNAQTLEVCELRPMSAACLVSNCDPRAYAHKAYRMVRHAVQDRVGGLARHVDQFVSISGLSQRMIAQHLPADTRYVKLRNPIDVGDRPAPADPGASDAFVMVARMYAPKGWDMFLDACRLASVQAIAVGDGVDREALERRHPEARFVGQLDRAGVTAVVRSARALVLPSRWYETQGLVIDEASAQGVPSIVSDRCGGAENIEADRSGLLFKQGSLEDLVAAIRRLAGNADLSRQLGRAAWTRFWNDPPTAAAHANAVLSIYEQVLDGKPAVLRAAASAAPAASLAEPSMDLAP